MLVDLGRNDLGRVCEPGTIALPHVLEVEWYSHVMHLSSTVTGALRAAALGRAIDLAEAVFDPGN